MKLEDGLTTELLENGLFRIYGDFSTLIEIAKKFKCSNKRKTYWNVGSAGEGYEWIPTFKGLLGEKIAAYILDQETNFNVGTYKYDLDYNGSVIEVKTTETNSLLVMSVYEDGKRVPFYSDYYFAIKIAKGNVKENPKEFILSFKGFVTRKDLENFPDVNPLRKGGWKNKQISFNDLTYSI